MGKSPSLEDMLASSQRCAEALSPDETRKLTICRAPGNPYECYERSPQGALEVMKFNDDCRGALKAVKARGWID